MIGLTARAPAVHRFHALRADLVSAKGFPAEFRSYFEYCRSLRFEDRPDYALLRRLLKDLFFQEGYQYDYVFDWNMLKFGGSRGPETEAEQRYVRK